MKFDSVFSLRCDVMKFISADFAFMLLKKVHCVFFILSPTQKCNLFLSGNVNSQGSNLDEVVNLMETPRE